MYDDDFGTILCCAVRYSLGRRTYMPELVCSWIKVHCAGKLSVKTLGVIIRDIQEHGHMDSSAYGDTWDYRMWMDFLRWCEEQKAAAEKAEKKNEQRE